jgi:hypothetical protein
MLLRRLLQIILGCGVLLGAALMVGVFYERAQRGEFRRKVPPIGVTVDIGGRNMQMYCAGEGSPTVILEPPPGWPGLSRNALLLKISPFTKVCWYDRAGTGWSDPGPFPRTPEGIAQDLHALLVSADIPEPYILVGSRGAARSLVVFRNLYPTKVAGIVLTEGQTETVSDPAPYLLYPLNVLAQVLARTGVLRLVDDDSGDREPPAELTAEQQATLTALIRQPESRAAEWSAAVMQGRESDVPADTAPVPDDDIKVAGAVAHRVEGFRAKSRPIEDPPTPPESPTGASASPRQPLPSRRRREPPDPPRRDRKRNTARRGAGLAQASRRKK